MLGKTARWWENGDACFVKLDGVAFAEQGRDETSIAMPQPPEGLFAVSAQLRDVMLQDFPVEGIDADVNGLLTRVHGAMLGAIETRVVETVRAFQPQTLLRHSDCDGVLKTQR